MSPPNTSERDHDRHGIGGNHPPPDQRIAPEPRPVLGPIPLLQKTHQLTPKRVYQLERDREIEIVRIGRRSFVVMATLDAYIERLRAEKREPRPMPNPHARRRLPEEAAAAEPSVAPRAVDVTKPRSGRRRGAV
jgi:hypothetical protein